MVSVVLVDNSVYLAEIVCVLLLIVLCIKTTTACLEKTKLTNTKTHSNCPLDLNLT